MIPQKKEIDFRGMLVPLAGGILLVGLLVPAVRRGLAGLGIIALDLSILVVVGLLGFGLYRLGFRKGMETTENPFATPPSGPDQTEGPAATPNDEADASSDLLEPALRRRYPWRHGVPHHS